MTKKGLRAVMEVETIRTFGQELMGEAKIP